MNHTQIEEDEIDIGKLFSHLKKNKLTIFIITFIITFLVTLYAYFLKPIYTSDVTIAFSDEKTTKLTSIIPDELGSFGNSEKELETVKLTLETRKFINSAIQDLDISQRYYVEHNYKKNAVYSFINLKVDLDIHDDIYSSLTDETLYEEYFEILPIDNEHFKLSINNLDYSKTCKYNEKINEKYFTITVRKEGDLENKKYFITKSNPELLADSILRNMSTTILSDNVLKISYNDLVAQRAKEIVEEIAESFRAYTLKKKTSEISKTLGFLNKEIKGIELVLQSEGKNLKDYQTKSDTFLTVEANNISLFETITKKEEQIKDLRLQLSELKNFKRALKRGKLNTISLLNSGIEFSSIQSLIELFRADEIELNEMSLQAKNIEKSITENPQLSKNIEKLNQQKEELQELYFNFTKGHPQVIKAEYDLAQTKTKIENYIRTTIKKLQNNRYSIKEKILNNITMTEKNIKNRLTALNHDVRYKHKLLQTLPEKSLDIQELKRKFSLSENIYTFLLQKKMEMEISLASTIANTQIIENAREAFTPSKPNKSLISIVGFISALILAIFYTFIRAMLDTKIYDEIAIRELTDAPLYGTLPHKNNKRFFEEALRNIRTNLQFVQNNDTKCTKMLISSTIPGEGKTTVIAGLAKIISQTDKKVLIMDLDLRKPRLYQELGKSNKLGMTQYIIGNFELEKSIQNISDNLDFFPAGAVPPNPSELLMSEKFTKTIAKLSEQYDYILFDTAPIGSVIDANMLLNHSDIILLVVRANIAEKGFIENFNRLRKDKNINSSGIILNGVKDGNDSGYGYGYGYGYGN